MKGYTTIDKIESYLTYTIQTYFQLKVNDWITAMENYVDNYTKRNFIADTEASTRLYDGLGDIYLNIDDCIAITKVEVGNDTYGDNFTEKSAGGTDGYYKFPTNNEADGYPINKLMLRNNTWTIGRANNKITAKWGYSESVPEDIALATTILVARIIKSTPKINGALTQEKVGNYSMAKDDKEISEYKKAIQILDKYKKFEI